MPKLPIRPEDILSEGESFTQFGNVTVRKGFIAAFLSNIDIIETTNISEQEKLEALNVIKELAPAVIAAGLSRHANFKNELVQQILTEVDNLNNN